MVRVRFAPSPTGFLHVGNARTALVNWLFTKANGGEFLLRLDDTDLARSEERYAEAIKRDLEWLGLHHDSFAKQSDRFARYDAAVEQLKKAGRLYPCYELPEELEFKRKRQLSKGEPPIYDRAALNLSAEERKKLEAEGRQVYWRFKLIPERVYWHDLVRGDVEFQGDHLSDPVLVRADGAYLYTLTSVVDDIDFAITHIVRGEDHVTNTAVQIQLFQALGATIPKFAHLNLLTDEKGQGLSKRLASLSLFKLRESGIEAMTINCFLARLGTSLPIESILTLDELVKSFDFKTFSRATPKFNPAELNDLNHKLLQIMPYAQVKDRLEVIGATRIDESLWNLLRGNLNTLEDILEWQAVCFADITPIIDDAEYIKQALALLPKEPWSKETWKEWTLALKAETGRSGKNLYMPLRQALTGHEHGPEMQELLPILGYNRALKRLGKS